MLLTGACLALTATGQEGPNLGVEADPEAIAAWDIGIGPDGEGLPPGAGQDNRQLLALRNDDIRLHSPCHALPAAPDAQR